MKTNLSLYLLLAAATSGIALSAETAYTTPVGYNTQALAQGFNAVGLTLQTPTISSGNLETVTALNVSDAGTTFSPIAGKTYILEIISGSQIGTIQEIPATSLSGSTINTPNNLLQQGVVVGDKYKLRIAPTLESIFTLTSISAGGVLQPAASAGNADIIWVPTGSGSYDQYYLRSGATPEFRNVATNVASPNVPIIYADGLFIQKKQATAANLTVSGEVKLVGTNSVAVQGFNLFSSVAPIGLNLFNSGIETNLQAAASEGNADIVWIQAPNLSYSQYFRRSGTGAGWRKVGVVPAVTLTQAQAEAVVLSPGFLVQRKGSNPTNVKLNVPANFLSL